MRHEALVRFWALDHHRAESVSPPPSEWTTLVYAGSGALAFATEDHRWVLPSNRAFLLAPRAAYRMSTLAPMQVRSLYFAPDFIPERETGPIAVSNLLRELILTACERGPLMDGDVTHESLAHLVRSEVSRAPTLGDSLPWPKTPWLRAFADAAFDSSGTLESRVRLTGYSRRTVERAIVDETGLSLGHWFRQARMLRSRIRLGEGATVSEASLIAGYSETSAYIQAFRRLYHLTPGQFRT